MRLCTWIAGPIHPELCRYLFGAATQHEPAEAQKASFGLGVALVCRVVCPPGVYASLFWMNSKWIKPLKPKRVWMRPSRPLGGVTPFTWPKVPIKVLYATLWLIRTNGVNACTYGAHPGNANWVFSAPIRYLVP